MHSGRQPREPAIPRWVFLPSVFLFLVMYALPGLFSSYRAWVQVRSLELIVPGEQVRSGDTIRVHTVSWGRTYVDVDLLLIQGSRTDTLAFHEIPKNYNASIDPRWRRDSILVVVTDSLLLPFYRGRATLRATAIGGPQWLRTPPPLVR
jgi:hypothetical protein